ncbi:MAG: hypothetical protein S4CHLAM102_00860 [Chlamydiia bacterium]|nr:hypothetical protein [Chlamydiia bacterium]
MPYFLDFKPLIKSAYGQTVLSSLIDFDSGIRSKTHYLDLTDGDVLAYEESTPDAWRPDMPIVVMVHGLCGSHRSHYMKRISRKFFNKNVKAIRLNLRGCGSGKGLARNIYHSGCSPDIAFALRTIKKQYPDAPLYLIGFSLGANLVLKLAGELGEKAKDLLHGVISVSPPVDLLSSARLFAQPSNHFYERYFLKLLIEDITFIHNKFEDLPKYDLPANININDFDELYVAPRANFPSALDYYRVCSSKRVIRDIKIPAKILFAQDDPIILHTSLDGIALPKNVQVYKTKYGGHIGYMGINVFKEFRWLDHRVTGWFDELEKKRRPR